MKKKLIAFLLFVTTIAPTIGTCLYYSAQITLNRYTVYSVVYEKKEAILPHIFEITEENIHEFQFSFFNKKEFEKDGKMYDVVREVERGDKKIIWAIGDQREDNILADYKNTIKEFFRTTLPIKKSSTLLSIYQQLPIYCQEFIDYRFHNSQFIHLRMIERIDYIRRLYSKILVYDILHPPEA